LAKETEESEEEGKEGKQKRKNVSAQILRRKQNAKDDPMSHIGIVTMNHKIPYRKPILKQVTSTIGTRGNGVLILSLGVIKEIEEKHGGLSAKNFISATGEARKSPKGKPMENGFFPERLNKMRKMLLRKQRLSRKGSHPVFEPAYFSLRS